MNMELSALALKATTIAMSVINKVSDRMLDKAASDILSFLTKRFSDRLHINKCNPKQLEATILSEAKQDESFRSELEKLVNKYYNMKSTDSVIQQTKSGVNINVDGNTGTVIGQQIDQRLFRE